MKIRIDGNPDSENPNLRWIFDSSMPRFLKMEIRIRIAPDILFVDAKTGVRNVLIYGNPGTENSDSRRKFNSSIPRPTFGKMSWSLNFGFTEIWTLSYDFSFSKEKVRPLRPKLCTDVFGVDDVVCQLFDPERASGLSLISSSQTGKIP